MSEKSERTFVVCVSIQTATSTIFEQSAEIDPGRAALSMRLVQQMNNEVRDQLITLMPCEKGAVSSVGRNHDLLERALSLLVHEAISFAECSCQCATDGTPLPGTCQPEAVEDLEGYLQLIRDIESEVGPTTEPEPEWFEDLIDQRWSLIEKAGAA